jgi:hypothetical protein
MADLRDKSTTSFPENDEYLERIKAAKAEKVPVGGVAMPKMPRFDQPLPDRNQPVQAPINPADHRGIMSPEQMAELQKRGQFIPGAGSAYGFNQPAFNAVQGKNDDPSLKKAAEGQEYANPPRPAGAGLSTETAEQLKAVAQANTPDAPPANTKEKAKGDKELDAATKELDDIEDQFDVDEFGQRVHNLLVNRERREAIEKRCTPMDVEELLIRGEIHQVVPIIPGKLEVDFRSMSGAEDLFVKRRLFGLKTSAQAVLDTLTVMNLTCSLTSINRRPLPTHLDKDNDIDDTLFEAKMKLLLRLPIQLLADLSVNYSWFDRRVKKLFVTDEIKGF